VRSSLLDDRAPPEVSQGAHILDALHCGADDPGRLTFIA